MLPLTFFEVIGFFLPMAYNYCVAIFVYNRLHSSSRRDEVTVSYLWRYGSACSTLLDTVIYRSSALFLLAPWIRKSVLAIKIAYAHPVRQILPCFCLLKRNSFFPGTISRLLFVALKLLPFLVWENTILKESIVYLWNIPITAMDH